MKFSETAFKFAFFGMKHEANDIIDYVAINFSVLVSIIVGAVAAVWIGHVVSVPAGLIAGIALYVFSMIVCYFALLHGHRS
ncbi:MAG: hypothetical protein WA673_01750 [Candidatus Acidiferrales bacterium]